MTQIHCGTLHQPKQNFVASSGMSLDGHIVALYKSVHGWPWTRNPLKTLPTMLLGSALPLWLWQESLNTSQWRLPHWSLYFSTLLRSSRYCTSVPPVSLLRLVQAPYLWANTTSTLLMSWLNMLRQSWCFSCICLPKPQRVHWTRRQTSWAHSFAAEFHNQKGVQSTFIFGEVSHCLPYYDVTWKFNLFVVDQVNLGAFSSALSIILFVLMALTFFLHPFCSYLECVRNCIPYHQESC